MRNGSVKGRKRVTPNEIAAALRAYAPGGANQALQNALNEIGAAGASVSTEITESVFRHSVIGAPLGADVDGGGE